MGSPTSLKMAKSAPDVDIGHHSARAATSTAAVTLKPSLSLLSLAIMSASGVDVANNKRGGRRSAQHRFCHSRFDMHKGNLSGSILHATIQTKTEIKH